MTTRKRGLGRGLDALLGSVERNYSAPTDTDVDTESAPQTGGSDARLSEVLLDDIHPGQYQPRRIMHDASLEELAASIRSQGVMQPVVLRRRATGGYELIAGERRWRATRMAGLDRIPAVIRDVSDERAVAMALIENIQREDLNPLEEAMALQRLQEEFHLTQQQVADAVGKSRVAVTNLLRLLNLVAPVRQMLADGLLEMGHARALLSLAPSQQEMAARQVIQRALSVRQTEALARNFGAAAAPRPQPKSKDRDTRRLETELSERLGAPVTINFDGKSKGELIVRYSSIEELDGILRHIR
jgi:ParB family transcriptional regulator, chromosome partitioning protein